MLLSFLAISLALATGALAKIKPGVYEIRMNPAFGSERISVPVGKSQTKNNTLVAGLVGDQNFRIEAVLDDTYYSIKQLGSGRYVGRKLLSAPSGAPRFSKRLDLFPTPQPWFISTVNESALTHMISVNDQAAGYWMVGRLNPKTMSASIELVDIKQKTVDIADLAVTVTPVNAC